MDRRQLNLAGRIVDPVGPLCHLWALALQADQNGCELPPSCSGGCFLLCNERPPQRASSENSARLSGPLRRHDAVYKRLPGLVRQEVQKTPIEGSQVR